MDPFTPLDIVFDTWLTGLFYAVSLFEDKDCFLRKGPGPLDCLSYDGLFRMGLSQRANKEGSKMP